MNHTEEIKDLQERIQYMDMLLDQCQAVIERRTMTIRWLQVTCIYLLILLLIFWFA